jgi:hypothetical protein
MASGPKSSVFFLSSSSSSYPSFFFFFFFFFFLFCFFCNGVGDLRACSVLQVWEAIFLIELGCIVSTAVLELRMTIEIFIGQGLNQILLGCMAFDSFFILFF